MPYSIDWGVLNGNPTANVLGAYEGGRKMAQARARENALAQYANTPSMNTLAPLAAIDPATYATLSKNERDRDQLARQAQARNMIPDVLAGVGVGGAGPVSNAAATGPDGEVTVTAPVHHKTIADLYALDPEIAGNLATRISSMQEDHRKQLGYQTDTLASAAFAALQVPYPKRREVIDSFRGPLRDAGFTDDDIDAYEPSDEALAASVTHSLGVKGALANHLAETRADEAKRHNAVIEGQGATRLGLAGGALALARDREHRIANGGSATGDLTGAGTDELLRLARGGD